MPVSAAAACRTWGAGGQVVLQRAGHDPGRQVGRAAAGVRLQRDPAQYPGLALHGQPAQREQEDQHRDRRHRGPEPRLAGDPAPGRLVDNQCVVRPELRPRAVT